MQGDTRVVPPHRPHRRALTTGRSWISGAIPLDPSSTPSCCMPQVTLQGNEGYIKCITEESLHAHDWFWRQRHDAPGQVLLPRYGSRKPLGPLDVREAISLALGGMPETAPEAVLASSDPLPEVVRRTWGLVTEMEAFRGIHQPESEESIEQGLRRLKFEEIFLTQVWAWLWRRCAGIGRQAR